MPSAKSSRSNPQSGLEGSLSFDVFMTSPEYENHLIEVWREVKSCPALLSWTSPPSIGAKVKPEYRLTTGT